MMKGKWKKILAALMMTAIVASGIPVGFAYAADTTEEKVQTETAKESSLNYIYVESPYLEAPAAQNIAVSWGNGTENIQNMRLTVVREDGRTEEWSSSEKTAHLYLFTKEYQDVNESSTYTAESIRFTENGKEQTVNLSDLNAAAEFGVNKKYEGYGEHVTALNGEPEAETTVVTISEDGQMEAQDTIAEALNEVNAENKKLKNGTERSSEIVVALDPGHDKKHAGASGNGLKEHELTLKIANYTKAELEQYAGVRVYMTRTTEECPYPETGKSSECIEKRADAAAKEGARVFVSFHLNASNYSSVNGAEVIFPNDSWKPQVGADGKALAQNIQDELVKLGLKDRDIYSKDTTINEKYPDGSTSDYFSVQICNKENGIPGIIVEHAFISNSNDANKYLKTEAGLKSLGVADAKGIVKFLGASKGNWEFEAGKGWRYKKFNGYAANGWESIGGKWYYFGADTYMRSGWMDLNGARYYLGTDGGRRTGWHFIDGEWYYFDKEGKMLKGWKFIDGEWYCLGTDGIMHRGWLEEGGQKYFMNASGVMARGWSVIENQKYYFNMSGFMQKGWQQIDGSRYYLSTDGVMRTDWQFVDGKWYYLNEAGVMQIGWQKLGGVWYYLNIEGVMQTDWKFIDGRWYYMNGSGVMQIGWKYLGGCWYYLSASGTMQTGWQYLNGNWYYMNSSGVMQTGWQTIGGTKYYFDESGVWRK